MSPEQAMNKWVVMVIKNFVSGAYELSDKRFPVFQCRANSSDPWIIEGKTRLVMNVRAWFAKPLHDTLQSICLQNAAIIKQDGMGDDVMHSPG